LQVCKHVVCVSEEYAWGALKHLRPAHSDFARTIS